MDVNELNAYSTRSKAKNIAQKVVDADETTITIDAEFVSRAFADELVSMAVAENLHIDARDSTESVQKMFRIVSKGNDARLERVDTSLSTASE